jgi:hypothetical protein
MKVPEGQIFYAPGGPYKGGDDIPDDVIAALPADHPLKTPAPRPARPAPEAK